MIISGPSGVGKGSICNILRAQCPEIVFAVSATTRKPRAGEIHGVNYYFLEKDDFLQKIKNGEFLEWAQVYGNYYGTLHSEVDRLRDNGHDVVLEIDVQGAMQIKKASSDGIYIFILPPSFDELKRRIISRGSEDAKTIELRLAKAAGEMNCAGEYDYQVINDVLANTVEQIKKIILDIKRQQVC